ncbi:TPA: hypothetical protein UNJ94_004462 [Stenotrophomonas maltophilia]|nr:hypothetical protein [Stenotrophomonas maltophilia]
MAKKTPAQKIAALEAQLARAKDEARRLRTRRLIQAGAVFEPVLDEWESLDEITRRNFGHTIAEKVRILASRGPVSPPPAPPSPADAP